MGIDLKHKALTVPRFELRDYVLRKIRPEDVHSVFAGLSHPDVIAHYGVFYQTLDATAEQMQWYERLVSERRGIWWGIAKNSDDQLVGACGFNDWRPDDRSIELGYWLSPGYWKRGIMRRALPHILRHAFTHMGIHRVHADVEPENPASFYLLRKLGFVHEGTLRDVEYKDDGYVSLHQLSLIKTDPAAIALLETPLG
ncbi:MULTISPECIES: GNAT family N-acetyltransferase [Pseudomonas]|uniref:GNAT family N-acetyltransferase n=1 Tax=Pseudomonas TaxID=286 RepID=UPI000CDB8C96|nr:MULTISPECIES: GNAT family protein [Pseudomonas]POR67613.1 GNAT family N-acetyltransferase [Pseudomonas syringae pv. syringae]POR75064.1 GNAT family N-acetyltransferase [Pseudomonas syringae pv. syringae]BBN63445.1 ribosomal-protein-alanine N-acetyltransferase [Pseudomonas sp. KUIN-1]